MTKASTVLKKINFSEIFPFKCIRKQIWPWRLVGQGQPRIIIWTNLVGPTSPMLHTKSQGHRPSGSGEEDFQMVFTLHGHGGHLGHVPRIIWTNFRSPILRSLHMKFEFNWSSGFRGENVWKCWRRTDEGVTGILIAHLGAFSSGELKKLFKLASRNLVCD